MRYQTFGRRSGLRVSELVLGTATFGTAASSAGAAGSRQIFETYVGAGGTTFDTSNLYQGGEAETMLGTLLGTMRDDFVLITKYGGTREANPRPGTTGNGRKTMIRSLEQSLRRLGTDHVDVFMPHFPDGTTPLDEILAGFDDLVRAGKIRYGGLSNFPAWRAAGAAVRADLRGLAPLTGIQTAYNLAERSAERELIPMAEAHGLAVMVYSPLAGGLLTGKYRRGGAGRLSAGETTPETTRQAAVIDAVLEVADETGISPTQASLAWLRRKAAEARTTVVPIAGPRTVEQLEEYLEALTVDLGDKHHRRLDAVSAPRLGTPHEDVHAAMRQGFDGDRDLLDHPLVPVI